MSAVHEAPLPYPVFAAMDRLPRELLTREEEHQLAVRARAGDHRARGELVERNLRLVVKIAVGYARRAPQVDLQDLVSEGVLGLMHAIEKFDPHSGFKLSTYATWWIRQAVRRSIDQACIVSIPIEEQGELPAGERPLTLSLDHQIPGVDSSVTLGEIIPDQHNVDPADVVAGDLDTKAAVAAATEALTPHEHRLVEERFGLGGTAPTTVTASAAALGLSVDATRRLERHAILRMQRSATDTHERAPCAMSLTCSAAHGVEALG